MVSLNIHTRVVNYGKIISDNSGAGIYREVINFHFISTLYVIFEHTANSELILLVKQ